MEGWITWLYSSEVRLAIKQLLSNTFVLHGAGKAREQTTGTCEIGVEELSVHGT